LRIAQSFHFKGNLHNSTPEGDKVPLSPFSILARKWQKTRLKTLAHIYARRRKNIIFGGNRPEIVELCKKSIKNKKVNFRGRF
jgi:hypothetical protein